ncbi:MAG: FAD-dependent oxidoreductase, partial [Saprospiraceae bacterium]
VSQLICDVMKLGEPDGSGRRSPIATGETFSIEVDMIIKAAGQMPYSDLVSAHQIENINGKVTVRDTSITNLKGVFAGGDCVNGGKEVVDAVQAGKDGAAEIMKYLS